MNIQKYKALIKTIELESFTKAADALGYSQSGISRMIGDLENEWNVTLLERSKSGLKLMQKASAKHTTKCRCRLIPSTD